MPGAGVRLGEAVVSRHCPVLHWLLPASPQLPAPIHVLPVTSCATTTWGTLRCHGLLHTPGSPVAPGRLASHAQALSLCCRPRGDPRSLLACYCLRSPSHG